jgi:signal recognition particle GTPase
VTKLDGTARGGFIVSVVKDLGIPIKLIGVGEKISDLRDFDAEVFVDALLGNDEVKARQLKERVENMLDITPVGLLAEQQLQREENDAAARLKESFNTNNNNEKLNQSQKPKRPKRTKPAQNKKKKKS